MAPLKPVLGAARVALTGTYGTTKWANIFHVHDNTANPYSQADIDFIASNVRSLWATHMLPNISADASMTGSTAVDLTNDLGLVGVSNVTTVGGSVGSDLPANVSLAISWKVARHYRGGHPRTYLPGISLLNTLNERSFQPAFVTAVNDDATAFRNAVNALVTPTGRNLQLMAVSRIRNKVVIDPPVKMPITGNSVDNRIDSQRRRLGPDV